MVRMFKPLAFVGVALMISSAPAFAQTGPLGLDLDPLHIFTPGPGPNLDPFHVAHPLPASATAGPIVGKAKPAPVKAAAKHHRHKAKKKA